MSTAGYTPWARLRRPVDRLLGVVPPAPPSDRRSSSSDTTWASASASLIRSATSRCSVLLVEVALDLPPPGVRGRRQPGARGPQVGRGRLGDPPRGARSRASSGPRRPLGRPARARRRVHVVDDHRHRVAALPDVAGTWGGPGGRLHRPATCVSMYSLRLRMRATNGEAMGRPARRRGHTAGGRGRGCRWSAAPAPAARAPRRGRPARRACPRRNAAGDRQAGRGR